ncbi:MAG: rpe [Firmicutes bacterium]|nr:rpe [Bacillota bacterium]
MIRIAPSMLSADFTNLKNEILRAEQAGADMLHIDVMDGHFVPNLTFGAPVVAALRKVTNLPFDVHLMVTNPQDLIEDFYQAGADIITVHVETAPHLHRLVQTIKAKGIQAGVALNPATSLTTVEEILPEVDMVLIMSVNPGFGGQKFIPFSVQKIKKLKQMLNECQSSAVIQVDGGINAETAKTVISAGADILVAGSAVYGANDLAQAIQTLRGD